MSFDRFDGPGVRALLRQQKALSEIDGAVRRIATTNAALTEYERNLRLVGDAFERQRRIVDAVERSAKVAARVAKPLKP